MIPFERMMRERTICAPERYGCMHEIVTRQQDRHASPAPKSLVRMPEWLRHPKWKWLRIPLGGLLCLGGVLGFLPILGFWMVPLGLAILALDFPAAARANHWLHLKVRRLRARWRLYRRSRP
jgi:hypothetical protein